ncbi:MAG: HEAT repeat domain-containing protein [Planctomycetota bacterium]
MNISLFYDWIEGCYYGEGELAHLVADIVDEAMAHDTPGEFDPAERVEQALLESAWHMAETEDETVRARAAVLLGRLGYRGVEQALDNVEQCDDASIAGAATIVLARLRGIDDQMLAKLLAIAEDPAASRELRSAAAKSTAAAGSPAATAELVRIAQSEEPDLAQYGMEGLGHTKPDPRSPQHEEAFQALLAGLEIKDPILQAAAAEALGEFGDTAAMRPLEAVLIEKDPTVRRRALFALAKLGAESAKPPLTRMIRDFSVPARWEIIDLLGRYYGESMVDVIALAAEDRDAEMRDHVVAALARMDGPASLQILQKIAQSDSDTFVREQAETALTKRQEQAPAAPPAPEAVLEPAPQPQEGAPPPPPPRPPASVPPPPPRPAARLRPLFPAAEPEAAPEGPGREEKPKTVIEHALESMECTWWLDPAGYQTEVPAEGDKGKISILLGETDYEGSPVYRFVVNCGRVRPASFEAALRNNRDLDYGSLAIANVDGVPSFVLTDTMLAGAATIAGIRKTLTSLARSAAALRA